MGFQSVKVWQFSQGMFNAPCGLRTDARGTACCCCAGMAGHNRDTTAINSWITGGFKTTLYPRPASHLVLQHALTSPNRFPHYPIRE